MRTLLMFASMVLVATGTFCIANFSVPFTSVAFVVGAALLFMGACELFVDRGRAIRTDSDEIDIEGMITVVLGAVFISGEIVDDSAVTAMFALWATVEGLRTITATNFHISANSTSDNINQALGVVTSLVGIYSFFNIALFNFKAVGIVGVIIILIGINRFQFATMVQYKKPSFLTGNEEKLAKAKEEEKEVMQRAKDAVRETKEIQRRISEIEEQIRRERLFIVNDDERRRTKK